MATADPVLPDLTLIDRLVDQALQEDVGAGDITTAAIAGTPEPCCAVIFAKADGVAAGIPIAERVFHRLDSALEIESCVNDGATLQQGDHVLRIHGPLNGVLTGERTALNFLAHLSGIATHTARYVAAVTGTNTRILDTRKTTPGLRLLEKYAVVCGGGMNHRTGLYDMFLIKDNHIDLAGGLSAAVERIQQYKEENALSALVEVEAESFDQLREALNLPVDRILVDNMTPAQLSEAVAIAGGRVPLEASGGITLENVRAYAETGVDFISIGALTHSAPAFDFSLRMKEFLQ